MAGYIRTDISCYNKHSITLIPTIEISTWDKGIEVAFLLLCFCFYANISYIKEDEYEP